MTVVSRILAELLLGGMVYVSLLVAPIIFIVLDDPEATLFTRTLWPVYFIVNGIVAGLAGIVFLISTTSLAPASPLLVTGGLMGVNWGFAKRMQSLRDPGDSFEPNSTYQWMHKFTVWTNWVCIILVAGFVLHGHLS